MSIKEFIVSLTKMNFSLSVEDGKLSLKGDKKKLSKQEIDAIKVNKEVIGFIKVHKDELIKYISGLSEPAQTKKSKNISSIYRLSGLQEGMLFHGLYDEGARAYEVHFNCDLIGLDPLLFKESWRYILKHHSILRSAFYYDSFNAPVQCVYREVEVPVEILDYSAMPAAEQAEAIKIYEAANSNKGFDFEKPPLTRFALIRLTENRYRMLWTTHHILFDGWSLPILMEEFLTTYELLASGQKIKEREEDRFEDFIRYIEKADKEQEEAYWRNYLKSIEQSTLLPFIESTSERTKGAGEYGSVAINIDTDTTARIQAYAQKHHITVNTLMQGVWSYLLHQYTSNPDIVYGVIVSGRPDDLSGVEQRVGMYINTLPLHSQINDEQNVTEWLQQIQDEQVQSRKYQYTALNDIQRWSGIKGDLFDTLFVFENYPASKLIAAREWSLGVENVQSHEQTNYPLTLLVNSSEHIHVQFSYNSQLLSELYVTEIRDHFEHVLLQMTADKENKVSDIKLLSPDKEQVLKVLNATDATYPTDTSIVGLFEQQAAKHPDLTAVAFGQEKLTYTDLNKRANQLAHYLQLKGVTAETLVPICIERGIDMIVGILGILKAGGAYVPIDPEYPLERINFIIQDTTAKVVVSSKESSGKLAHVEALIVETDGNWNNTQEYSSENLASKPTLNQLAYIIYTSGSTGEPKGVMVEHINVVRLFVTDPCWFDFNEKDVWTMFHSFCFDFSVWEMFGALLYGGKLVIVPKEVAQDASLFAELIVSEKVTILNQTPSAFYNLQDAVAENKQNAPSVRYIIFGGEALNPAKLNFWKLKYETCRLINMYGITETTVHVTFQEIGWDEIKAGRSVIGKAIPTLNLLILDSKQNLVPLGVPGELYVGGAGLARAYLNRPELTRERFIADPFSKDKTSRLYKTGDMACWLPDGNVEYLGRLDDQVKIRGYRIELGEIEAVLNQHPSVKQGIILATGAAGSDKRLIGYVVSQGTFVRENIQAHLRSKLPDYMVPTLWVELDKLPLTRNGKVDKKALLTPDLNTQLSTEYIAPQNETEKKLAQIWQELLKIERIGIHDDFFELGGHSLLAMRAISSIRREMSAELGIKDIFIRPTVALLSAYLNEQGKGTTLPAIIAGARPSKIPLSFSQERLWFIDQLEGSRQYHMPAVLSIKGNLDVDALNNTLNHIVNRHEVLRSVIRQHDGQPYQQPRDINQWSLEVVEEEAWVEHKNDFTNFIQELIQKPFDLAEDFMLRAQLITIGRKDYVLVVTLHHIASDGWSRSILVKEIVELYASHKNGTASNLSPLPIQYADFAIWQQSYLQGDVLDNKIDYWKKQLDGTATLNLPTDFTRPAVQSTKGASVEFKLSQQLSEKINELNQSQGTTLYMSLLAVFKVLLHRYSGQNDICVGTGIAGRQQHETEGLIGFFVNTLAMRSQVYGDAAFSEFLQEVKATTLEAYSHQEVPFEKIVDAVVTERDLSRNPLVQVTFIVQNTPEIPQLALDDVELSVIGFDHITSRFDISFGVKPTATGIEFLVEYCADLFHAETIERMVGHYQQLLQLVLENPDQKIDNLHLITTKELQQISAFSNANLSAQPSGETLISLFEKQVDETPDGIALVFEQQTLTYKALNEKANQVARFLSTSGVQKDMLVPICIQRSPEMIVGILGIMKAGGAYVPIDPSYPQDRIGFMLEDTAATLLVCSDAASQNLTIPSGVRKILVDGTEKERIETQDTNNLSVTISNNQLAYVIYTSGSTGKPKGVLIEHQSVTNLIERQTEYFGIDSTERIIQFSNYCFDASVEQLFLALTNGAALVLFEEGLQLNPERFSEFLNEAGITHLHSTPFFLENLNPAKCGNLRRIIAAGDLCRRELVNKWTGKADFYNKYGPTEAAISVAEYKADSAAFKHATSVPIGKPLANVEVYVLDKNFVVCPIGIPGEIHVGGIQVARGYLNRPDITSEKFIEAPVASSPSSRLYKTGDLGRWLPDGNLEYLGRIDDQVKIHGYRIETGEIESVLNQLPSVDNSCVVVKEDKDTRNNRLVVYYLPNRSAVKLKETQLYDEQVASWKEIHENEYTADHEIHENPEFDILGWNDSFTRSPIPAEHMQEWLADIVDVIFADKVEHVLEIGSGSGLIYYQLAGKVKKYIGTDFSKTSINLIRNRINLGLRDYGPTELQVSAAHEVALSDTEAIDTIVLNSIIQYFPGEDYLSKVIENGISILKNNGRIIIGDVRDLRTLKLFKARIKLEKQPDLVSLTEFDWYLEQDMLNEEELCFAPEYFYNLQTKIPQITHVEIVWKHGSYINELTAYRYTVVIYVGLEKEVFQPDWQTWNPAEGSANIIAQLEKSVPVIALKDVPNPRLQRETELFNILKNGSVKSVSQLVSELDNVSELADVNAIISIAEAKGYSYKFLLDEDPLKLNILMELSPADKLIGQVFSESSTDAEKKPFTNIPLFNDICSQLQKDIRNLMLEALPEYMVPSKFTAIQKMPLNSNGKIDRKFLTLIENKASGRRTDYQAPRSEMEKAISEIWKNLINIEQAGINDNFFELGGHSLLAVRVISMIRKELNVELIIRDLFSYPTIAELAEHLQTLESGSFLPAITVEARPDLIPLSFSQERLWFIDQLEGSVQYHIPAVLRLKGALNREALNHAFKALINRHEVLRTVIQVREGQGYQYLRQADNWNLEVIQSGAIQEESVQAYIKSLINTPFNLSEDYMLRAQLIEVSNQDYLLVATMHHIASDGWSTSILVQEITALYTAFAENREPELPPLAIQYADYALWQRRVLSDEIIEKGLDYWKQKLQGVTPLQLITDYTRTTESNRGAIAEIKIDRGLHQDLQNLSRQQGSTLYMTLLSAFKILLSRYSGQQDICVGTSAAGRTQHEVENLIGFFINTMALRTEVKPDATFTDLLQDVRTTSLEAFEHEYVPFEKVVDAVVKTRDTGSNPLFQIMFVLQNTPDVPDLRLGDLQLSTERGEHTTAIFDFTISIKETPDNLAVQLEYKTDLFKAATVERMLEHFRTLLQSIVASPEEKIGLLSMMTDEEKLQLSSFASSKSGYREESSIVSLFEEQALKTPLATALIYGQQELTYRELNERSNHLANYLKSIGVQPEQLVPVCLGRGIELMVSILAILKAGAAYVPVDTSYPSDRIKFILEDTEASIAIAGKTDKHKLPYIAGLDLIEVDGEDQKVIQAQANSNPKNSINPGQLSYVIYTSGSTGIPKGVLVEHRNVVSLVKDVDYVTIQEQDRLLVTGSPSFDATTFEYWSMLLNGGALVLCSEEALLDSEKLKSNIRNQKISTMWFTSSWFNQLIDMDLSIFDGLQTVLAGGEKLSEPHVAKFRTGHPDIKLLNGYGPTENTTFSLTYQISEVSESVSIPIGKPLSNRSAFILDEKQKAVPIGIPGEIYLGGAGLSRGYLNRPQLTEEKFISNPFGDTPDSKLYKTGDLGRWLLDGNIEYLGRMDEQVKIRGYRIEPGEIETVLLQSGLVTQAVVQAQEITKGGKQLVAYVVAENVFDKAAIQNYLSDRLPDYMIPAAWVELENIPLTPNGKVDKKALPDADLGNQLSNQYTPPGNETEESLAAIWSSLLGVEHVGIHDNFFEIGGHSLLAMRVSSAIRQQLNTELSIKELFVHPTISGLSTHLITEGKVSLLPPVIKEPRPDFIPLSFGQERLWFIDQLEGSTQYHIPVVLSFNGALNIEALQYALQQVVNRHEVLRTVIQEKDGQGYQYIQATDNWTLRLIDRRAKDNGNIQHFVEALTKHPFALSKDPMLRAELIQLADEQYLLVVTVHHISSDGWSASILVKEVVELYQSYIEKRNPLLADLTVQYADYAIWQRAYLNGEVLTKKLEYWKEKLADVAALQLPADFTRPALQTYNGATANFEVERQLAANLQALSRKQGATMYMTLLSAFNILLSRYSSQDDICVGTPIANRTQHEVEELIGFFVNTLAIRTEVKNDNSFIEVLNMVKTTMLEAYAHQDVPFEKVVDAVAKERDLSRSPLFQVMFILQNTPDVPEIRLQETTLSTSPFVSTVSKFDLTFTFTEIPKGLNYSIQYNTDLYTESTVQRMAAHFNQLMNSIVSNPDKQVSQLQIIAEQEKNTLLRDFNTTEKAYPRDKNLIDLFYEQVKYTPAATALVFGNEKVTYQELNEQSNQLARYLLTNGLKPEQLVPICIERSLWMVTAILGIMKAGGAYVPVDTEYPEDRINFMLDDTSAELVITSKASKHKLGSTSNIKVIEVDGIDFGAIQTQLSDNLENSISPSQLAYVIYTSGSTGKPKGVMVEHKGVVNLALSQAEALCLKPGMRTLQFASFGFDASCYEIFNTLLSGGCLVLCTKEDLLSAEALQTLISKQQIEVAVLPPSYQHSIINSLGTLKTIVSAGEPLNEGIARQIQAQNVRLVNAYGPTEATVCVSLTDSPINKDGVITIGQPIANLQVYILDSTNGLSPIGVPGELCVSGIQVARGYLNREELSREKFIENPFSESGFKLYKTGDLAKWLPDGNIEYLGRIDEQVKIRGYRIELGEIENVLQQSGLVTQAVVLAKADATGFKRLVAYVQTEETYNKEELQFYLQTKLPDYMVPALWVEVEQFSLTPSGKIDKKALPDPDISGQLNTEYVAPRNQTEQTLAKIWQELLGVSQVGIHDNFFELGGHSLLAMRAISSIRKELNIDLGIKELFIQPTIAQLATYLDQQNKGLKMPSIEAGERPSQIPLSFSQERLWFIHQLEGSVQYNQPTVLKLKGDLNQNALEYSIKEILNRHEVLRTVFYEADGKPFQLIKTAEDWKLLQVDGSAYRDDVEGLKNAIENLINLPFDLAADYMLRAHLIEIADEDHRLVVTLHHIAADAWSLPIIVSEVVELYSAYLEKRTPNLPQLPVQFADYAIWQRQFTTDEVWDKKKAYWRNKLDGVQPLQLPTDFNRPTVRTVNGASASLRLDEELSEQLHQLSNREGVTLYMTLLATFNVLLNKYSGDEDICVGASIANRPQQELEGLIGFFVNTLALRNRVDETVEFTQFLQQVKTTMVEAYEYQDVPFEKVVEEVVKERDTSRSPLFQVMLVLLNTPESTRLGFGEVELTNESFDIKISKVDITFHVSLTSKGLHILIVYNTDLFRKDTINRMAGHFNQLLKAVVENPDQMIDSLQMLTEEEEQQLLNEFNKMQQ